MPTAAGGAAACLVHELFLSLVASVFVCTVAAMVDAGGSVRYLENEKDGVIKLHATIKDLKFDLAADGVHIKLSRAMSGS
jgi:hypothetical protein